MTLLQQQFIGLQLQNITQNPKINSLIDNMDMEENMDNNNLDNFEVEDILDHKGLVVEDSIYLVKWKNYPDSENQWLHYSRFNEKYKDDMQIHVVFIFKGVGRDILRVLQNIFDISNIFVPFDSKMDEMDKLSILKLLFRS
ncbi:hypothetical protein EDC94DRAFT_591213 [Helicostylum pulchrum]|nr:hypothetical protein EDC94DRAFT_591213 [Helicostylum pulchrum]